VRDKLAALRRPPPDDRGRVTQARPPGGELGAASATAVPRAVLVAFAEPASAAPLVAALDAEVDAWVRARHRQPRKIDPSKLDPKTAAASVAASGGDLAFGFWILDYSAEPGPPPMARARVRVQITSASAVVFDRVVATDTVLGDKGSSPWALARRVAREVLAILRPHVRRTVPSWQ